MFLQVAQGALQINVLSGGEPWADLEKGGRAGLFVTRIPAFQTRYKLQHSEQFIDTSAAATDYPGHASGCKKVAWGSRQAEHARGGLSRLCPTLMYASLGTGQSFAIAKVPEMRAKNTYSEGLGEK